MAVLHIQGDDITVGRLASIFDKRPEVLTDLLHNDQECELGQLTTALLSLKRVAKRLEAREDVSAIIDGVIDAAYELDEIQEELLSRFESTSTRSPAGGFLTVRRIPAEMLNR